MTKRRNWMTGFVITKPDKATTDFFELAREKPKVLGRRKTGERQNDYRFLTKSHE